MIEYNYGSTAGLWLVMKNNRERYKNSYYNPHNDDKDKEPNDDKKFYIKMAIGIMSIILICAIAYLISK